jgi:N-dimethylarginine dimethylaminohydrolase
MKDNIGTVNKELARMQWEKLKNTYEQLGFTVSVIPGVPNLPDMVFTANQSFPYSGGDGEKTVIISKMESKYRQPEVEYFAQWYSSQDYRVVRQISPPVNFEGMGDARWHPGRKLLYIGFGFRTDEEALRRAASFIDCPIIGLKLIHPHFYHLDTALCPLDEETAIYIEEAFTSKGIEVLETIFPRLIRVPSEEALTGFVANGHSPDQKNFIVQKGNYRSQEIITNLGFNVLEVDTSEFIKSGGSVFCMKMMLP